MALVKSVGNMYHWVTHMHTHLGGKCPHECSYCYVGKNRYGVIPRYEGELRLIEKEFQVNYGNGKTIFIEHMNDLFASIVPPIFIERILSHCRMYPENVYVFQSKNPYRMMTYLDDIPLNLIIGTTVETNRDIAISKAPSPIQRIIAMPLNTVETKTFITIEPIMKFDLVKFVQMLKDANPTFINIGADSKHCNLPEPSPAEVKELIKAIQDLGIEIKVKHNLERLLR